MGGDYMGDIATYPQTFNRALIDYLKQKQMAVENKPDLHKENREIEDSVNEILEKHPDPRWRATMYHMLRLDGMNESVAREIRVRRGMSR